MDERITGVDQMRSWTDKIPLRYEYTAGVAGEKFLRGLQHGKILAATCEKCGKSYLPPKMYCVDCFSPISKFEDVGSEGRIGALTESWVDFDGRRTKEPSMFAFVTFKGVIGGLVHRVNGKGLKVGSKVLAQFAPEPKRTGSLTDIEWFVAV
ncbi:MAG: Zn-ribbon domain-containing OB-fold protein [Nitrososphaerales archaeon]|nr:Zn-ribbon domain-containing OB-fold protein [Nitrososphaerales archaeon]